MKVNINESYISVCYIICLLVVFSLFRYLKYINHIASYNCNYKFQQVMYILLNMTTSYQQ